MDVAAAGYAPEAVPQPADRLQITLKPFELDAEIFQVSVDETVGNFKHLIHERLAVEPSCQELLYRKMPLSDDCASFEALNISNGAILTLIMKDPTFVINVKFPLGRVCSLEVTSKMSVEEFSLRLETEMGVPAETQRLITGGKQMKPPGQLSDYNIASDSMVYFIRRFPEPEPEFIIHIEKMPKKKGYDVYTRMEAHANMSIEELKLKVEIESGVAPEAQHLMFQGKALDPPGKLCTYGVENGSTVHFVDRLLETSPEPFDINVRSMNVTATYRRTVQVTATMPIEELKQKIEAWTGIPAEEQRLFFDDFDMESPYRIGDYGLISNSTVGFNIKPAASQASDAPA